MLKGYYFITDSKLSRRGNISDVKNAVACGVRVIQHRDKYFTTRNFYEEALKLRFICKNTIFLINDRVDIALAVKADGVHLGSSDVPYELARKILGNKKIIGLTVHSIREAKKAQKLGANYIGVSPVFPTKTKNDAGIPKGVELIKEIRKIVSIPIIAIGGINLSNAKSVVESGADGICAISAVVAKSNIKKEINKFQALFIK